MLLQMGFRTTSVSGGQLLHNNQPVLLRGVNRHEWHERWGEQRCRHLLLLRRACSHTCSDSWMRVMARLGYLLVHAAAAMLPRRHAVQAR